MNKKLYFIKIFGNSCGYCTRELTKDEYELINSIFDECESTYILSKNLQPLITF